MGQKFNGASFWLQTHRFPPKQRAVQLWVRGPGRFKIPSAQALPRACKSSNALILKFSGREKLEMRAFELSQSPSPSPSLEKFKRAHFGVFRPEKLEMRAFELLPCPIPSPSLEKCKRVLFLWSFRSFRLGQRCVPCRVVSLQPMLRVVVFRFGHSYVSCVSFPCFSIRVSRFVSRPPCK